MILHPSGPPKHFVVFLPGFMGSQLRDRNTRKIVWVDFSALPRNPLRWDEWFFDVIDAMLYPNEALEAVGLATNMQFLPSWIKLEPYDRLLQAVQGLGYKLNPRRYEESDRDLYTFPYDWRQDHRISARQLATAVERWRSLHPGAEVWIIAHGTGGLVARWYIEQLEGKDAVRRLFLIAAPWDGAPKAMALLKNGLDIMWRRAFDQFGVGEESRRMLRSYPAIYSLIPARKPFLLDQHSEPVDPFKRDGWLEAMRERAYLADARRFIAALGDGDSVETVSFFGVRELTVSEATVFLEQDAWGDIEWWSTVLGDGAIPVDSATHPGAQRQAGVIASHGDICMNDDALAILRWELAGKFRGLSRPVPASADLQVTFEADKDCYEPGAPIQVWATLHGASDEAQPIAGARIGVELTGYEPLPGSLDASGPSAILGANMQPDPKMAGRYHGALAAPLSEGYYRLQARIFLPGRRPLHVEEVIAVEWPQDG